MTESSEKIKWGIIGPGNIAHDFVQDLLLLDDGYPVAVGSRNLERAKAFANQYQIKNYYSSYEEVLSDPMVDIVYIATPHDSHLEWAIKALDAKKHVLCEKPLAVNVSQVEQMIAAAKRNNCFLMEALWSRFNPSIRACLALVEAGTIGTVNYVNAEFNFPVDAPEDSRMLNMDLAGGSLLDMGIYPVFLAYIMMGKPIEILASSHFHKTGADIQTTAIFKYKTGMATILSGFVSQSDMQAKIYGTTGSLYLDPTWHEAQGYQLIKGNKTEKIAFPTLGKGFSYEIMESHSCLRNKQIESLHWSHQNSLELMQILDDIRNQIGLKYPFE